MADPTTPSAPATPTGGNAPLAAPDFSQLEGDIAAVESQYEPRIQKGEEEARGYEAKAVSAEEQVSSEAERQAGDLSAEDEEMQHWIDHTPTRQAIYATGMHAAPALAILTALGGKLTKLNGMQMLAATNGIVQGINESNEQKYNESLSAWQASYQKMRDHQRELETAHRLMLTSYQGRADAYQRAAEAARRMTGDILDDKQRQVAEKIDTFKAQSAAWDKIQRVNIANDALKERARRDIQQAAHWKQLEQKSAAMPPQVKAQLAAEHSRWQNAKAQFDENMKRRGQTVSSLSLPEDIRASQLQSIDEANERLRQVMDTSQANADAIIAGFAASRPPTPTPAATPTDAHHGTIDRPGQPAAPQPGTSDAGGGETPSPAKLAALQKNKGQAVTFGDGSVWIMDDSGAARRVQ